MPSTGTVIAAGTLLTFGESMGLISAIGIGTLEHARDARVTIGGAESNVAIGAARLGTTVTWIGRVGDDAIGDLIERRLRSDGIETRAIRDSGYSGLMVRHHRNATSVSVDYHRAGSAGSHLTPDDIPQELVTGSAMLHVTGITPALSDTAHACVVHAVRTAARAKVTISIDVNYRAKLWDRKTARDTLTPLVAGAQIVFAGVEEAQLILGSTDTDPVVLVRGLAALGPDEAIIKDGARGCTALIDAVEYHEPALQVPLIDPVGAGDAFVAGYLAERIIGEDAPRRLHTAIAMGAYAVTVPGDCELLPTRAELLALSGSQDVLR